MTLTSRFLFPSIIVTALIMHYAGCSSVPREVVELSYAMGEDISAIQESYVRLVRLHFEALRRERIRYLEEEWTPLYIKTWITDGRLIDVAKGVAVWSEEQEGFVTPTKGREEEGLLKTVGFWSTAAVAEIGTKREELLKPLNSQEAELTSWISEAFNRIYRGNATITAHLNSLRQVQEVQDEALSALHLKGLRDKINGALVTSSDKAKEGLDLVRKADGIIENVKKDIHK